VAFTGFSAGFVYKTHLPTAGTTWRTPHIVVFTGVWVGFVYKTHIPTTVVIDRSNGATVTLNPALAPIYLNGESITTFTILDRGYIVVRGELLIGTVVFTGVSAVFVFKTASVARRVRGEVIISWCSLEFRLLVVLVYETHLPTAGTTWRTSHIVVFTGVSAIFVYKTRPQYVCT
jgi:hypothetical protein